MPSNVAFTSSRSAIGHRRRVCTIGWTAGSVIIRYVPSKLPMSLKHSGNFLTSASVDPSHVWVFTEQLMVTSANTVLVGRSSRTGPGESTT